MPSTAPESELQIQEMLCWGQVQAPVVLLYQALDLDKNMLTEALVGGVNEEDGFSPHCVLIMYQG